VKGSEGLGSCPSPSILGSKLFGFYECKEL